jgi:hypothetical protein
MVKHCVLVKLRSDNPDGTAENVLRELAGLKEKIPGILDFCGGAYSSGEGLNRGYTHGFIMTFESAAARDGYLVHPEHVAVAQRLLPFVEGGIDGVVAFDFEA